MTVVFEAWEGCMLVAWALDSIDVHYTLAVGTMAVPEWAFSKD